MLDAHSPLLSSGCSWVRAAAVRALAKTDPLGVHLDRLLGMVQDPSPDVVDAVLEQVSQLNASNKGSYIARWVLVLRRVLCGSNCKHSGTTTAQP